MGDITMQMGRRRFLTLMALTTCSACTAKYKPGTSLTIGMVKDDQSIKAIAPYDRFKIYLREKTHSLVEVEPVMNEDRALSQIQSKAWALVFAPPGLAAIAISQFKFIPLFPLTGVQNLRSAIVVRADSPIQDLKSLAGKALALGRPGSATGYYLPLFNLYGLTLSELIVPGSPANILEAVAQGKAAAGALSVAEFDTYRSQIDAQFRILSVDPHTVPTGALLLSPDVEQKLAEALRKALSEVDSVMAEATGFVTNAPVPDYRYLISVVERVRSIFPGDTTENASLLQQKPVRLFQTINNRSDDRNATSVK